MTLHQSLNLANLFFFACLRQHPLGLLRESSARYSFRWFLFIHLSIPFIILARLGYGFGWRIVPFTIAFAVIGQILGSRLKRRGTPVSGKRPSLARAVAIGDLLRSLLRQQGLAGKMEEYRAWQVWDAVVGPQIATRARPIRLREGVLEVRVEQAVWMQQLQLMKPQILARLNERLGSAVIKDIFWRRGRLEEMSVNQVRKPEGPDWRAVSLSQEETSAIERTAGAIGDSDLRQQLQQLFTRQQRLEKARRNHSAR